mmetsp:Transcript_38217/g.89859  ORF Transcript_38217/g.89859 Transcript_38217/m.89859 type:complete len:222 (+) Transcript_38217:733-1398(+)
MRSRVAESGLAEASSSKIASRSCESSSACGISCARACCCATEVHATVWKTSPLGASLSRVHSNSRANSFRNCSTKIGSAFAARPLPGGAPTTNTARRVEGLGRSRPAAAHRRAYMARTGWGGTRLEKPSGSLPVVSSGVARLEKTRRLRLYLASTDSLNQAMSSREPSFVSLSCTNSAKACDFKSMPNHSLQCSGTEESNRSSSKKSRATARALTFAGGIT